MNINFTLRKIAPYLLLCGVCSAVSFVAGRYTVNEAKPAVTAANAGPKSKSAGIKIISTNLAASLASQGITMNNLLKSPGTPNAEQVALWAASLSPQDCAAALAALQAMPVGVQRDALLKAVVDAWAKHDPAGFLASSGQMNNPRLRETGVNEALHDLATKDPQAALDWLKQNPGTGGASAIEARVNSVIAGYAANNPADAFDYINSMSDATKQDAKLKTDAFDAFAQGMAQTGQFGNAMSLLDQLPAGKLRNSATNSMIDQWGAAAPLNAANWIANSANPSVVSDLNETLVGSWVKSDPAAAAVYAVQAEQLLQDQGTLGGQNNTDTLPNTISAWAKYDLNAAGNFINQMPASPVKDRALSTFISTASKVDPASAIAWTTAASDPAVGNKLMVQVAKQWQQNDPQAYSQFLATTTTLTPAQLDTLTNLPAPAATAKKGAANSGNGQGNSPN
ncbi:MAG TPA: hypothetical protein VK737_01430 [Opitutales bacterium]|nr:hypothetical protein [Opitutales bacterium]